MIRRYGSSIRKYVGSSIRRKRRRASDLELTHITPRRIK
jgi:hypothetical protein